MTRQCLWVILCHLPEKGRKDIAELKDEEREKQKMMDKSNNSAETKTKY